jgi:hypothetical protein
MCFLVNLIWKSDKEVIMKFFTFSWGNNYIAIRGLLRVLGHTLETPTDVSMEAIKQGTTLAHPFLCYSGKVVVGQIQEQLEAGQRNFIFMSSLCGQACRCADTAGFMELLFKDKYPGFRAMRLGGNWVEDSFDNMNQYFPEVSLSQHNHACLIFGMKVELLFLIEKTCLKLRSMAKDPDKVRVLEKTFIQNIDKYNHPLSLIWCGIQFQWEAKKVRLKKEKPVIRVGVVGGEHILSELDSIMARIKDLAEKGVYLEWRSGFRYLMRACNYEEPLKGKEGLAYMQKLCQRYLHPVPQTSEIFSCVHALEFAAEGFDGIIHIYAMGCMPQTALKPALKKISAEKNIPILELGLGEKFNEAGIETRLDAFIDLLKQKKSGGLRSALISTRN